MAYFPPYIDGEGLHLPTYEDRLEDLLSAYRSVFGAEAELSESVPDYQLLSVFARALDDVSALILQAYNSRNPFYASGQALDLLLPQYGLLRNPGETDASARNRIASALAGRSAAGYDALLAALRQAKNVRDAVIRVNETGETDEAGIPPHTIAPVILGGNARAVAEALWNKKAPGVGTYGSSSEQVTDAFGNAHTVRFSRVTESVAMIYITITKLEGCDEDAVGEAVSSAVRDFVNALGIGVPLIIPRLYAACYAAAPALSGTFVVTDIQACALGDAEMKRDLLPCAWNGKVSAPAGAVTVTFRTV